MLDEIERRPGNWGDLLAWLGTVQLAVEGVGWDASNI